MKSPEFVLPDRRGFGIDPFGYSALAWHKWAMAQTLAGFPVDPGKGPSGDDLKSPILWLAHAHALSEAATVVLRGSPNLDVMPETVRGIIDTQYCAVGLMLMGYSLEVCLKGMLIIRKGVPAYTAGEKKHRHHRLEELSDFIPGLSEKDRAILRCLTHFVLWAGRYPDPGTGKESDTEEIFTLSEKHRIPARELFELSSRVMQHTRQIVDGEAGVRESPPDSPAAC